MSRPGRAAVALALALAAPEVRAEEPSSSTEWSLRLQGYRPAVDSDFSGGTGPWALAFGDGKAWGGRLEYARTWTTVAGTLGLGGGLGYLGANGHGLYRDETTGELVESGDATALHVIPTSVFASWRLDTVGRGTRLPLAPYVRLALERFNWMATGTGHDTRYGATNGWSVTAGAALYLDALDRPSAREFERETGIRHTALTLDVTRSRIDDFGSPRSWDLSSQGWAMSAGLLLGF